MKQYILKAEIRVDEEDIRKAKIWAREKGLDYKDDIAHLVLDCISEHGPVVHEILKTEIDEEIKSN